MENINIKLNEKLNKMGKLHFTATSQDIIDERLEYYGYDHNISNISRDNCSLCTTFIIDNGVVKETTTLYDGKVPLKTWNFTYSKNNLSYVIDDEYYSKFYLER